MCQIKSQLMHLNNLTSKEYRLIAENQKSQKVFSTKTGVPTILLSD